MSIFMLWGFQLSKKLATYDEIRKWINDNYTIDIGLMEIYFNMGKDGEVIRIAHKIKNSNKTLPRKIRENINFWLNEEIKR